MKNLLIILISSLLVTSCETKSSVQSDIDKLKTERYTLQQNVQSIYIVKDSIESEIATLNDELKEKNIYISGKTPKYILKLHLKQTHITLDIGEHMKDAMNAIDFEMPVDKEFYNTVSKGTKIVDEFRSGSLIMKGSFGDWEMTVNSKEIR